MDRRLRALTRRGLLLVRLLTHTHTHTRTHTHAHTHRDSLLSIAASAKTTVRAILENNPDLLDHESLAVGQVRDGVTSSSKMIV